MKDRAQSAQRPPGGASALRVFGAFLWAAALVAALAAATMLWPETALSGVWAVKEAAFRELLRARIPAALAFALLGAALAAAAFGWRRRLRWGWALATAIVSVNLAGDVAAAAATSQWANLAGAAVEALVLAWLLAPATRAAFEQPKGPPDGPPP